MQHLDNFKTQLGLDSKICIFNQRLRLVEELTRLVYMRKQNLLPF